MRSVTAAMVLVWAVSAFAGQGISGSNGDAQGAEKPRAEWVILMMGQRPIDAGGILYREHRGGFWGCVHSVAFSAGGRYLLSAGSDSNDGTVRLWDVETGEEMRRYGGAGHSSQYESVAFSPDGRYVLAGSYKSGGSDPHAAWLWDVDTTSQVRRYSGHTTHYAGGVKVGFSPDGTSVVTACVDGPAIHWDTATGDDIRQLGDWVVSAAFSPDGNRIVTGARNGEITVWDTTSGAQRHKFGIDGSARSIEFSPDSQRLLVRSWNAVYYLDANNGNVVHRFSFDRSTHAAALSPDGRHALIGATYREHSNVGPSGNGRAELYDLSTGKRVRTFEEKEAYDGWITAAAFSPDGRSVATGSLHGPVRLWEVGTGRQIRAFYGHLGRGPDISFWVDGPEALGTGPSGQLVQIASGIWALERYDDRQRQWLDRIRRQQTLTVGGSGSQPVIEPARCWFHSVPAPQ